MVSWLEAWPRTMPLLRTCKPGIACLGIADMTFLGKKWHGRYVCTIELVKGFLKGLDSITTGMGE